MLDGVTGSGKTEVYFEAVAEAIRQGKQVLIMVPEISLTTQWLGRFERRFGVMPAKWHSALGNRERLETWKAAADGRAQVLIGARSALFLPYKNLGLIVVDECHDHSFKQEDVVNYQGRDMAVVRAKFENFPIILSTATPSLETINNVEEGKYGFSMSMPKECPECHSEEGLTACGPGVERIAEEVKARFPTARVKIISSDITASMTEVSAVIHEMEQGMVDILIGTQILAKGHHFPALTLVGIVDADLGLMGSDLRASEQTYQLLSQVSGRAGRGEKKGTVYLQTLYPENAVLKALINNDRQEFLKLEKQSRKILKMPPFGKLAALIVSGTNQEAAERLAVWVRDWLAKVKIPSGVRVEVDIDPYSFM